VKEGKIDVDELKALLDEEIETNEEYYRFSWAGKSEARREANKPSTATLRPNKADSKNWDTTGNIFIEGDNLEVLKLLQKSYAGKIKMMYFDPPYNTGKDFVYKDNYADNLGNYLALTGQTDEEGKKLSTNSESDGRYHSNWLNMMYPRLKLARNLLTDDGVVFISIDDNEVYNLHKLCDEIFGEENFIGLFPWRKRTAKSDVPFGVSQDFEWILCYAKSDKFTACIEGNERKYYETPDFPNNPWRIHDMSTQRTAEERPNSNFTIVNPKNGLEYPVNPNAVWRVTKDSFKQFHSENKIVFPGDYDFLKIANPVLRYLKNEDQQKSGELFGYVPVSTFLPKDVGMTQDGTKDFSKIFNEKIFSFPKPVSLIKFLLKVSTSINNDCLILDIFSGSGTTAHSVMKLNSIDGGNRKFICVQLPEMTDEKSDAYKAGYKNIAEICKERIRSAGSKILNEEISELDKLKKSIEGKMLQEETQEQIDALQLTINNLDTGFKAFKLDSSNIRAWDGSVENFEQNLFHAQNNIKENRSEDDVLFEILLKYGLDLTVPIEEKEVHACRVYSIGRGVLFVCLSDNITTAVADAIGQWKEELQPATCRALFKDNGFKDDVAKTNSIQILRQYGIEEVNSL
jgi:adenine-specific DNA-methyltransferase